MKDESERPPAWGLWIGALCVLSLTGWNCLSRRGPIPEALVATAQTQLEQFKKALDLYTRDHGRPPRGHEGLAALVRAPGESGTSSYLPDVTELPRDPWGNEYRYASPGTKGAAYEVISYGADGKPGGTGYDADLSVTGSRPN